MRADSSSSIGMLRPYCWKMKIAYGVAKVTMAAMTDHRLLVKPIILHDPIERDRQERRGIT